MIVIGMHYLVSLSGLGLVSPLPFFRRVDSINELFDRKPYCVISFTGRVMCDLPCQHLLTPLEQQQVFSFLTYFGFRAVLMCVKLFGSVITAVV